MDLAQKIAHTLVQESKAACVNIISGIRSIYRWEGKVCNEGEYLLLIKSSKEKFDAIRSTILLLHSNEVPEIIAIPITDGDPDYLSWLQSSVSGQQ